jgi:hypothetical protein
MGVPSLTQLCLQHLVNQFDQSSIPSYPVIPQEIRELIIFEKYANTWNWLPVYGGKSDGKSRLDFDFKPLASEKLHFSILQRVVSFIKKNKILIEIRFNHNFIKKLYIDVSYRTPSEQRTKSASGCLGRELCEIFQIRLPYKDENQAFVQSGKVKVAFRALSNINYWLKSGWEDNDYNKVKDFAIYYINQLARDNVGGIFNTPSATQMTNTRLSLAINSPNEEEMIHCLFSNDEKIIRRLC